MEDLKFEKAVEKLEKIVEFLESGEIPLEEALKKYEEGVKLSRLCSQQLAQAEKKIEILTRTLNGTLGTEPFDPEAIEKGAEQGKPRSKKESRTEKASGEEGLLF